MIDDDIRTLRAALAPGPTPGPWEVYDDPRYIISHVQVTDGEDRWHPIIACTDDDETLIDFEANSSYIAAAYPDRIERLLDEIERLRAVLLAQGSKE